MNIATTSDLTRERDRELAARMLREAFPPEDGVRVHDRIARAAEIMGLPFRRVRALWYREARRVDAHEIDVIKRFWAEVVARRARLLRDELLRIDPDHFHNEAQALEKVAERALALAAALETERRRA